MHWVACLCSDAILSRRLREYLASRRERQDLLIINADLPCWFVVHNTKCSNATEGALLSQVQVS